MQKMWIRDYSWHCERSSQTVQAVWTAIWATLNFISTCAYADKFMREVSSVTAPIGYVEYCKKPHAACVTQTKIERFSASPLNLSDLYEINRLVNAAIEPETDQDHYGVSERWAVPTTKGDCEDYALLKQRLLQAQGWPQNALLLTVVLDEKAQPHAVLTARTSQGDYILDNKTNEVKLWNRFPYHFVMRQSSSDPSKWYSIAK